MDARKYDLMREYLACVKSSIEQPNDLDNLIKCANLTNELHGETRISQISTRKTIRRKVICICPVAVMAVCVIGLGISLLSGFSAIPIVAGLLIIALTIYILKQAQQINSLKIAHRDYDACNKPTQTASNLFYNTLGKKEYHTANPQDCKQANEIRKIRAVR